MHDTDDRVRLLSRAREIAGVEDVEWLDPLPPVALHDDRELHSRRVIRIGSRLFAEMTEHPGEWWMGELDAHGKLHVWGSYGSLEKALKQH